MIHQTSAWYTSRHSSAGRALYLKTQGCGFDSWAGQPNNYESSFRWDFKPRSHLMVLYTEHIKKPGGTLNSFILYPCTIPHDNLLCSGGHHSHGQLVATIKKWKQKKKSSWWRFSLMQKTLLLKVNIVNQKNNKKKHLISAGWKF